MGTIHQFKGKDTFCWDDVTVQQYPGEIQGITKSEIIGKRDGAQNFAIRYFEVAPGSQTTLDNHEHDHGVVVIRGKGQLLLDKSKYAIGYGDAIYVKPYETHQFENNHDEPFGFICVIPPKKEGKLK